MVLSDKEIMERVLMDSMIEPFIGGSKPGQISAGLTSYGYDARLASEFKTTEPLQESDLVGRVIDPKNIDPRIFRTVNRPDYYDIPPHAFVLGRTIETFKIPRDILVICIGKSTYARCGILVTPTPLEPEWEGTVTIEISNTTPYPARIYVGEGICQFVFHRASQVCGRSYADKKGKYQGQVGVTLPRL